MRVVAKTTVQYILFKIPFCHGLCVFPMRRSLSWVRIVYSLVWTEPVSTNQRPESVANDQWENRNLTSSSHFVSFTGTTDHYWPGWRGNGRKLTPINVLNGKMCSYGDNEVWKLIFKRHLPSNPKAFWIPNPEIWTRVDTIILDTLIWFDFGNNMQEQ